MGKTLKGAAKTAAKIATKVKRAKGKIARKCGGKVCAIAALLLFAGCASTGQQPAKSQTQNNDVSFDMRSATINITLPNIATGERELVPLFELFTQAQSLESSGTETFSQTASPKNDTSVPITAKYNDALAAATPASMGVIGAIGQGIDGVLSLMKSKKAGTVQVTKTDGTNATVQCANGQCSFCEDGACSPK